MCLYYKFHIHTVPKSRYEWIHALILSCKMTYDMNKTEFHIRVRDFW